VVGRVMGITVRISVLAVPGGYLFPETTAAVPLRPAPPAGPANPPESERINSLAPGCRKPAKAAFHAHLAAVR